jgi:hypothetical protein
VTTTGSSTHLKPFRSQSVAKFKLDDSGDGTTVTWSMTGPITLMSRIMGSFKCMDRMVAPLFERGLARLEVGGFRLGGTATDPDDDASG